MNKVTLTGRITKDPEIRYSSTGSAYLFFTIAVDRMMKDANGQRQADFISCTAFSQTAEFMSRYVRKGNMLAVTGRLQTRQYQGQDNQMHYVTEVACEQVENLSPRDPNAQPNNGYQQQVNNSRSNPYQGYQNPSYGQQPQSYNSNNTNTAPSSFDVNVDDGDLPF